MMVTIIMLKNPNLFWARPLESYKDFCIVKQIKPSSKQTILGIFANKPIDLRSQNSVQAYCIIPK